MATILGTDQHIGRELALQMIASSIDLLVQIGIRQKERRVTSISTIVPGSGEAKPCSFASFTVFGRVAGQTTRLGEMLRKLWFLSLVLSALMAFVLFGRDRLPFEREKPADRRPVLADSGRAEFGKLPPAPWNTGCSLPGFAIQPLTFNLLSAAAALAAGVVTWAFLPGLPAIAAGALVFYIPSGWLDDKVKSRGRQIDTLLPLAVGRITAGLLAGGRGAGCAGGSREFPFG